MKKNLLTFSLILMMVLAIVSLAFPLVNAQEEPPSPEEEWYPPVPEQAQALPETYGYSTVSTSGATTALTARLLDLNLNPRMEFYRGDGMIFEFSTNFPTFWIWIYEWYPPGHIPKGHWLLWAVGPFTGGGTYRIGTFLPESTEPEGRHVWKCWIFDPTTWTWATAIIRFDFQERPRPVIVNVNVLPEMKLNKPYTIDVTIKNTGEKSYTYIVSVEGTGFTINPPSTTTVVGAGSTALLSFQVTPTVSGKLSLKVKVEADGRVYDSKIFAINVRALKPSHTLSVQSIPEEVKLGESVPISILFTNTGEGSAKQVTLRISSAEGVSFVKSSDTASEVPPGGSYVFNLAVKPESGGVKTLILQLDYIDDEGNRYSDSITVTLKVLVPLKISTAIEKKYKPLMIQFNVGGKQYAGSYEGWVTSEPIQVAVPSEWEISDDTIAEFVRWSDGNTAPSRTVQATIPLELIAEYRLKYHVKVTADEGSPTGTGWYYEGESITIEVDELIEGEEGVRYIFTGWNDGVKDAKRTITVSEPMEYHAGYKTQYYLTVLSDYGKPSGSGWYDSGSTATASIDETIIDLGFPYIMVFKGWSGDASGTGPESNPIHMDSPKKAVALWEKQISPIFYAVIGIVAVIAVAAVLTIKFKGKLFKTKKKKSSK